MTIPHTQSVLLCILDGWGESDDSAHNAIKQAHTPHWDRLWQGNPHSFLKSWGDAVGLPDKQMGNSEVGHLNLGAGRVFTQSLGRIDHAIASQSLTDSPPLKALLTEKRALKQKNVQLHLMGLFSDGGVHAHIAHMIALTHVLRPLELDICVHAFLDGRDSAPGCAQDALAHFQRDAAKSQIATFSGRYFAMDRDKNWERTKKAFDAIRFGRAEHHAKTPYDALKTLYDAGHSDEFFPPILVGDYRGIAPGDILIATNFRADRMRQLFSALGDPESDSFPHQPVIGKALSMMPYWDVKTPWSASIFDGIIPTNGLGETISKNALTQFRIAETEKYAHVTFFFNGGREKAFEGEVRKLIPSPKVATYDLQPEMSALSICDHLCAAMQQRQYSFLLANFANPDMVGHTGNLRAAIKAVETVDLCLGKICNIAKETDTTLLITADHGNIETMWDTRTNQPHTAHTINPVPLIYVGEDSFDVFLKDGILGDIAPTILHMLGLPCPTEMTGNRLFGQS